MGKGGAKKKKKEVEVVEKTPQELTVDKLNEALDGHISVHECCINGFEKRLLGLLEKNADSVNTPEAESGSTPLMLAAKYGKLKCCEILVENGADPNKAGFFGLTPLHLACRYDRLEVCTFLVETAKADVNIEDDAGNTPLHDASRQGNLKCVEVLANAGCDLEHTNSAGSTAFIAACLNARGALIEILFKRNVNIDAQDANGDTALHVVAAAGLERICRQLVNGGAKKDILNSDGKNASEVCINKAIAKLVSPEA